MLPSIVPDTSRQQPDETPLARLAGLFVPGGWDVASAVVTLIVFEIVYPSTQRMGGHATLQDCVVLLAAATFGAVPFCTCPRRAVGAKFVTFLLGFPAWLLAADTCARFATTASF